MPLDPQLLALLRDTVTIATWASVSATGEPVWNVGTTYSARIEDSRRMVLAQDGRQVVADRCIYVANPPTALGPRDKLTLPDNTTAIVIAMDTVEDEFGSTYYAAVYTSRGG